MYTIAPMETGGHSDANVDCDLIALISRGDESAFSEFYDLHSPLMFSAAVAILRDSSEAEDLLQEIFVTIWEKASTYDRSRGTPLAWVMTMIRTRSIDRLRSRKSKQSTIERAFEELKPAPPDGEDAAFLNVAVREMAFGLRTAMANLSSEQRTVLELAYFNGLSQSEIAETLSEPIGTIKARARRGMIQLRDQLRPFIDHE